MMAKPIAMLLMISFATTAISEPVSLLPDECDVDCVCYRPESMAQIANAIKKSDGCKTELKLYRDRVNEFEKAGTPAVEFWQQPGFVVGGIVVSLSIGILTGLMIR